MNVHYILKNKYVTSFRVVLDTIISLRLPVVELQVGSEGKKEKGGGSFMPRFAMALKSRCVS
jgi:hypothetical protein